MSDMETNETFDGQRWCRYEYVNPARNSAKFWAFTLEKLGRPTIIAYRWGRIGGGYTGSMRREHATEAEAYLECSKRVEAKLREGYVKITEYEPLRPDRAGFGVPVSEGLLGEIARMVREGSDRITPRGVMSEGEVIRDPLTRKIIGPKVSPKLEAIQAAARASTGRMAKALAEEARKQSLGFGPRLSALQASAQTAALERIRAAEAARRSACDHEVVRRWSDLDSGAKVWACVACGMRVAAPGASTGTEQPISLTNTDRKFDFGGK